MSYLLSESPDPHVQRRKEMLAKYPAELRTLIGNHSLTALWVLACVASQFLLAWFLREQGAFVIGLTAFLVGALLNHALYVFIHEASHNLIFDGARGNRWIGILCDAPLVLPGSMAFRKYHLLHHTRMGQVRYDADLTSDAEARAVGSRWLSKAIWACFLGLSQAFRPMRLKVVEFWDRWTALNLVSQVLIDVAVIYFLGPGALAYLLLSTFFALGGFHPLSGRWIAEHFVTREGQETFSYYGPMNLLAFNIGYHVEHHDLMTVPWVHLPKLRRIAPEFYDTLSSYRSYSGVLFRFILDPGLSLYSRYARREGGGA